MQESEQEKAPTWYHIVVLTHFHYIADDQYEKYLISQYRGTGMPAQQAEKP